MGLLDNLKAKLGPAKEKVGDLAQQHEGKIGQGLDKVAQVVDAKTKGKYSDRIASGADKAKDALGKVAHQDGTDGTDGTQRPPTPPPAS
ncbi:antitoxin [Streptomyces sp. BI20]|uniref:antitoxin n=1 Tax=Streptomyces sp. BI20 TaxID=3403460 RepID=UPI003C78E223